MGPPPLTFKRTKTLSFSIRIGTVQVVAVLAENSTGARPLNESRKRICARVQVAVSL